MKKIVFLIFIAFSKENAAFSQAIKKACKSYIQKNYPAALLYSRKAILDNPKSDEAYYIKAASEYQLKDTKNAILDLTQAIKLNTQQYDSYYLRAMIYFQKGDFFNFNQDADYLLDINPRNLINPEIIADIFLKKAYVEAENNPYLAFSFCDSAEVYNTNHLENLKQARSYVDSLYKKSSPYNQNNKANYKLKKDNSREKRSFREIKYSILIVIFLIIAIIGYLRKKE